MLYLTLHNSLWQKESSWKIASFGKQIAIMDKKYTKSRCHENIKNDTKSRTIRCQYIIESLIELHDKRNGKKKRDIWFHWTTNHWYEIWMMLPQHPSRWPWARSFRTETGAEQNQKAEQNAASYYQLVFMISIIAVISALIIGSIIEGVFQIPSMKTQECS